MIWRLQTTILAACIGHNTIYRSNWIDASQLLITTIAGLYMSCIRNTVVDLIVGKYQWWPFYPTRSLLWELQQIPRHRNGLLSHTSPILNVSRIVYATYWVLVDCTHVSGISVCQRVRIYLIQPANVIVHRFIYWTQRINICLTGGRVIVFSCTRSLVKKP